MRIANLAGRLVLVSGERAIDVSAASRGRYSSNPQEVFDVWSEFEQWAATVSHSTEGWMSYDTSDLLAPVPQPRQVFAIGLNYASHAAETGVERPQYPSVFTKFPSCIDGPTSSVAISGEKTDWEVELVIVIGREAHHVDAEQGWSHVAGLTIGQDLSDRAIQWRPPLPQFSLGKSLPGFGPTGPFLVTPEELHDRNDLAIACRLNDEVVQESRTSDMIFDVPTLIAQLSAVTTLLPGDLIFTGTPEGVGSARSPQMFLKPGDELVSSIEGLGTIRSRFTD